jgi:hypothetical protein
MDTVTSSDGTTIAFDRWGKGRSVILVGGVDGQPHNVAADAMAPAPQEFFGG